MLGIFKKIKIVGLLDYYISEGGDIMLRKGDKLIGKKLLTLKNPAYKSKNIKGWEDKSEKVWLRFRSGKQDLFKVAILILVVYRGNRGKEYREEYLDGNMDNVKLDNLKWKLKKKIVLYDVLSDDEFVAWNRKTNAIPKEEHAKYNSHLLKEYLKISWKIADDPKARERFFKKMFELN